MAIADRVYEREPEFSGRPGEWRSQYDSFADAKDYAQWLMDGSLDPFLEAAWDRIELRQVRDARGRFTSQWEVVVHITRPAPGEDYGPSTTLPTGTEVQL